MASPDLYRNRILTDIDEIDARVAALQRYFASKKINVKLDHYLQLECVRDHFSEFKSRIEEIACGDLISVQEQSVIDLSHQRLIEAVDLLLVSLEGKATKDC
jgi:hypothetical protein